MKIINTSLRWLLSCALLTFGVMKLIAPAEADQSKLYYAAAACLEILAATLLAFKANVRMTSFFIAIGAISASAVSWMFPATKCACFGSVIELGAMTRGLVASAVAVCAIACFFTSRKRHSVTRRSIPSWAISLAIATVIATGSVGFSAMNSKPSALSDVEADLHTRASEREIESRLLSEDNNETNPRNDDSATALRSPDVKNLSDQARQVLRKAESEREVSLQHQLRSMAERAATTLPEVELSDAAWKELDEKYRSHSESISKLGVDLGLKFREVADQRIEAGHFSEHEPADPAVRELRKNPPNGVKVMIRLGSRKGTVRLVQLPRHMWEPLQLATGSKISSEEVSFITWVKQFVSEVQARRG